MTHGTRHMTHTTNTTHDTWRIPFFAGFDEESSKQNYVRCSQQFSTYGYSLWPVVV